MSYALVEVEATAKKAARGAGYSWGLAEDAAKATRWLCEAGFDGARVLAGILEYVDQRDLSLMRPGAVGGDWRAHSGGLCPICTGTALSDSCAFWHKDGKTLAAVHFPLMLLPFAALSAKQLGRPVHVRWGDTVALTDGTGAAIKGNLHAPLLTECADVRIQVDQNSPTMPAPKSRAFPTTQIWEALERFAHRTYAPETEESRLKGAGAGLRDND